LQIDATKDLSEDVQRLLATTLVSWYPDLEHHWKFDLFKRLLETGSPVLAYLPRAFLYFMPPHHKEKLFVAIISFCLICQLGMETSYEVLSF
jgi:hypothetical protein